MTSLEDGMRRLSLISGARSAANSVRQPGMAAHSGPVIAVSTTEKKPPDGAVITKSSVPAPLAVNVNTSSNMAPRKLLDRRQQTSTTQRRQALAAVPKQMEMDDLVEMLKGDQLRGRVVVLTGAGISCPSGIPDFRTPGSGLYSNLQKYKIPYPEAIFDIEYFCRKPEPFFELARELYPSAGKYKPNIVHRFLRVLQDKQLLLRLYTQNIDGLERSVGIKQSLLVEAHGTFATATCGECDRIYLEDEIRNDVLAARVPRCKKAGCPGIVKPDIVFFGEDLPKKFHGHREDLNAARLVIVLGTSLTVEPFASLANNVRSTTPRALLNLKPVGPFVTGRRRWNDVTLTGDLVASVESLVGKLGWADDVHTISKEVDEKFVNLRKSRPHQPPVSQPRSNTNNAASSARLLTTQDNNLASLVHAANISTRIPPAKTTQQSTKTMPSARSAINSRNNAIVYGGRRKAPAAKPDSSNSDSSSDSDG